MDSVTVSAPAKINLMLDVTGRRPDGYHDLVTIMQSVSLRDRVTVTKGGDGITVRCPEKNIPTDRRNTAYRAAMEFFGYTDKTCSVTIDIEKKIPSEAGLGGGSADAAAVIVGLDKLLGTGLPEEALCGIGAKAGADVPFCIVGGTRLCRGIGEVMSPAPPLEDCVILLAKGAAGISTKAAYEKIDSLDHVSGAAAELYDGTLLSLEKIGGNIFEKVCGCPDVRKIKKSCLAYGAEYSAMSGSGSAVFGLFTDAGQAGNCAAALRSEGFRCTIGKPVPKGAKIVQNDNYTFKKL